EAAGKLRARLTSAAALADLGLVDPATAEIEAVRTAADALGHEPLRLAAAAAQGHVELQARRIDEAQRTLETVYWQANELDELALMTRAATELAFIHGRHRADPPTARRWERHADAALERRGRPPWEHAGLLNVQAANRLTEGDLEAGAALFEQAIASLERARGDRDLEIAVAATNLGEALSRLGRQPDAERALERAAAIRREHYGDEDVSQVSNMVHLAKVRERQGRAEEGVQLLMRARTLMERDDPGGHPWRPAVLTILGASLGRQERFTEAAEAFSAAIAQLDDAGHHDSQWAKLHKNLGLVHERLGHAAQAEQHYALALSGLDSGDPLRVEALLQVADFELQRGHRDRARARLAEAEAEAAASSGPLDRFTSEELERLRRQLG
ncbi:MAG: tetratricopeptide repeat protein, partial [Nannocystaceae bacterium]